MHLFMHAMPIDTHSVEKYSLIVHLAQSRVNTPVRWYPGWLTSVVSGGPQVAGMRYLHGILGPIIDRVFEEKKYVELDPSKVEVKDVG